MVIHQYVKVLYQKDYKILKVRKLYKGINQYGNTLKIQLEGCYVMGISFKTFAVHLYFNCCIVNYKPDAVRIGTAKALEFIFILYQPLNCIFNVFPHYLMPNLFSWFFHFQSLFPFYEIANF